MKLSCLVITSLLLLVLTGCFNTPPNDSVNVYWNGEVIDKISLDENNTFTITWKSDSKVTLFLTTLSYAEYTNLKPTELVNGDKILVLSAELKYPKSFTCSFDSSYIEIGCQNGDSTTPYFDITNMYTELPTELVLGVAFHTHENKMWVNSGTVVLD